MGIIFDASIVLKDLFTSPLKRIEQGMDEHVGQQKRLNAAIKDTGKGITDFGSKVALLAAPLEAAALAGAKLHSQFAAGMTKVSTLVDTSVVDMKRLEQGVREVSDATGVSVTDLAESEYQAISAGVDAAHVTEFLDTVTKASIAGYTDSTTAINGVTTVLNSYGMATSDASKVTDEMLITQNLGKTSFGELAQSIGNVTPIAKTLNVTTEELFGSLASLTKNGIATSEAVTGLKAAFSNIMKPSSEASKMAAQIGMDFSAAHLKSVGWAKFLDEIKEKTNGDTTAMTALFGSVKAANTIFSLTGQGAKDFKDALSAMSNQAGITDEVFQRIVQNDPTKAMAIVKNQLANIGMDLGTSLAPYINRAAVELKQLAKILNSMTPEQRDLVMAIGQSVIMFGLLTVGLGKAVSMYASVRSGATAAAKALNSLGVGGILTKHLPILKAFAKGTEEAAGKTNVFKRALASLGGGINKVFGLMTSPFETFRRLYTSGLEALGAKMASFFSRVIRIPGMIGGAIVRGLNVLAQIPGKISSIFSAIVNVIKNPITAFRNFFGVIRTGFTAIRALMAANPIGLALLALSLVIVFVIRHWQTFQQVVQTVWEHVSGTISGAVNRLKPVFERLWTAVQGAFDKICTALGIGQDTTESTSDSMSTAINTLGSVFSFIGDVIIGSIEVVVDVIGNSITTAINVFGDIITFLNSVFVGDWRGAWEAVKQIFVDIVDGIKQTFSDVIDSISGMIDRIIGRSHEAKEAAEDAKAAESADGHWTGSTWYSGGATWLHEQGPEIVTLPTGSQIIPHSESLQKEFERGLAAGSSRNSGAQISIEVPKLADQIVVRQPEDIDAIANKLAYKLKQYSINTMVGAVSM